MITLRLSHLQGDVHARFVVLVVPCPAVAEHRQLAKRILESIWYHLNTANVILLLPDNENTTSVYTFFPFSPLHECEHIRPVLHTLFSRQHGFPASIVLFPDKYSNLHGCPLRVATLSIPPFVLINHQHQDDNTSTYTAVDGIDGYLLSTLSQQMNYRQLIVDAGIHGDANATHATGCIGMVINKRVNMTIGHYGLISQRMRLMSASETMYIIVLIFVVPLGVPYTSLQKMLQPFQADLWTLLAGIAIATMVAVLLLDRCVPARWRKLFLGDDRRPLLSTIAIAFGCSVSPMPRRNLGRFMFLSWTFLMFVLRNTYQSYMFLFLQSEQLRARPVTMAGLVAANYTMHVEQATLGLVQNFPQLAGARFQIQSAKQLLHETATLSTITSNIAVMISNDILAYYNNQNRLAGGLQVAMPEERVGQIPTTMYMPIGSALLPKFNELIQLAISAGLMEYWIEKFAPTSSPSHRQSKTAPRTLLVEHLLGTFVLFAVLMMLAGSVFALEVLLHWYEKRPLK